MTPLPDGWTLSASAFNWTPEVIRAERSAMDIATDIVTAGISDVIEVEAGQIWRGFPSPSAAEATRIRDDLAAAGGSISIVGASIDEWRADGRRRTAEERTAFLIPQLHAAHRAGATGVRVPIGQPGREMLDTVLSLLHELDLVLFEETQGQQTPETEPYASAFETIADIDDPHVRVLVDISMLMPSLPESYIERLRRGGVAEPLLHRLSTSWRDADTHAAVVETLQRGDVPPHVHTMFMNLLVRFGRLEASDLRSILPLTAGVHLKFWDLDDTDGRVSQPIRDIAAELRRTEFTGTLCSEWGGHEWMDDVTPEQATRGHLAIARAAIATATA